MANALINPIAFTVGALFLVVPLVLAGYGFRLGWATRAVLAVGFALSAINATSSFSGGVCARVVPPFECSGGIFFSSK